MRASNLFATYFALQSAHRVFYALRELWTWNKRTEPQGTLMSCVCVCACRRAGGRGWVGWWLWVCGGVSVGVFPKHVYVNLEDVEKYAQS